MKLTKKSIAMGCACIAASGLLVGTVFADTAAKQLDAFYKQIKIKVNGVEKPLTDEDGNPVEPFIVDGTTYVPVRGVSQVLGKEVSWDGTSNSVMIRDTDSKNSVSILRDAENQYYTRVTQSDGRPVKVEVVPWTVAEDGRVRISKENDFIHEISTPEIWDKMGIQIFYEAGTTDGKFMLLKEGEYSELPGYHYFDNGVCEFVTSDINGDGEYELIYSLRGGSGVDYRYLYCYSKEEAIDCNFAFANTPFTLSKTPDNHVYLNFDSGKKAEARYLDGKIVVVYESVGEFDYQRETRTWKGSKGLKTDGFKNTASGPAGTQQQVVDRARNEATVDFNQVSVYRDKENKMWKVNFSTLNLVGGDQSVYLDENGVTKMITYGE